MIKGKLEIRKIGKLREWEKKPHDFKLVLKIPRLVKLQCGSKKNSPDECLFAYEPK